MGIRQDDLQTKWVLDEMVVDDLTVDQMRNGQSGCRRGENKPVNLPNLNNKHSEVNIIFEHLGFLLSKPGIIK